MPKAPRICDDPPPGIYRDGDTLRMVALTAAAERDAALLRLAGCRVSWNAMADDYRAAGEAER